MSYEGYTERLCVLGHLSRFNAYFDFFGEDEKPKCSHCGNEFMFSHSVDQTNGVEYMEDGVTPHLGTVGYPFEENGWEDMWHTDHYGNKYATKLYRYKIPSKETQGGK